MKKVLLVSMPFGAVERPSLGLSLLKARLETVNIPCDVRYLTFPFAEFIGSEEYQWLSFEAPYTAFAGDWSFTAVLYGERPETDRRYVQEVLREAWQLDERSIQRILRIRSLAPLYIDHCMAAVPWEEYALIGFTSTFEQNIASLAMAQRLKSVFPRAAIVFGGANWEGEMGQELHRRFPFVDYVCSGEADESFPILAARVLAGEPVHRDAAPLPGIVFRRHGETVATGAAATVREMDQLPIPDFSDFFHDLTQSTISASLLPVLMMETARGCWWGAKSHCTFCGLNGGTMAFRSKSPRRALAELEHLVDRWQTDYVEIVDNIIDMRYFSEVLPELARARRPVQLFYEVKANLNRGHVQMLKAANVTRIQPGIESMNDHVLQLMRKGTTALRNIQLLKWCQEYGVAAEWNLLYGFPGETRADYEATLKLLPALRFLRPPAACGPLRLDRFSPYFEAPDAFGVRNVRPLAPYRYLYPFPEASLHKIAYYFDYDYAPQVDPTGFAQAVIAYVDEWQRAPETGTLAALRRPDGTLLLADTRSEATAPYRVLSGVEQAAYEYCDELHTLKSVARHLRATCPETMLTDDQVQEMLIHFVAEGLMVRDQDHFLSLAIYTPPLPAPPRIGAAAPRLPEERRPSGEEQRPSGAELVVLQ